MPREPVPELDLGKVLTFYGVTYRDTSGWQNVLCPVHDERNPDCGINLDIGKIHCHACDFKKKDGLDLIMEKEGIGLVAAIEFADQEGFTRSNPGVHRGPPRKSGRGVSPRARDRSENGSAHAPGLRRPGYRT